MSLQNRQRRDAILFAACVGLMLIQQNLHAFCCCDGVIHHYTNKIDNYFRKIVDNETKSFNKVVEYFKKLEEDTKIRTGSKFKNSKYYDPLAKLLEIQKELKSFYDVNYRLDYALNFYKMENSEINYNFKQVMSMDSAFSELIGKQDSTIDAAVLKQKETDEVINQEKEDFGVMR